MGTFGSLQSDIIIDYDILKKKMGLGHLKTSDLTFQIFGDRRNPDRILIKDVKGRVLKDHKRKVKK